MSTTIQTINQTRMLGSPQWHSKIDMFYTIRESDTGIMRTPVSSPMDQADYETHLVNSITSTYKKSNHEKVESINRKAYEIAKELQLDGRMEKMQTSEAYITVKDHKENFNTNPTFRLIRVLNRLEHSRTC